MFIFTYVTGLISDYPFMSRALRGQVQEYIGAIFTCVSDLGPILFLRIKF